MPELPEVETVKRSLEKNIIGKTITSVDIYMPKIIRPDQPEQFKETVCGRQVVQLERRGKYLMLHLSNSLTMLLHLRMTGRLVYLAPGQVQPKHTHVLFYLNNGSQLAFADMRQFGRINLIPTAELENLPALKKLGPEPLGKHFNQHYLQKKLPKRRAKIKALLLDQTFVVGLGNIYADEALHLARIHPERIAASLNANEISTLYQTIVAVLEQGIKNRGTSFSDYVDGEGKKGSNQYLLRAYQREGQPCFFCGSIIRRKKVAGRSSYYCPCCQQPPGTGSPS